MTDVTIPPIPDGTNPVPAAIKSASGEPIPLAMQSMKVTGHVLPAGARLEIIHTFKCAIEEPMEIIYVAMLPRDAVLRKFTIEGKNFKVESELKTRDEARKTYEQGVEAGHLSALVETHVDGLTNLTVGQVRPGETVTVTLEVMAAVEHKADGYRFRFPLTVAPSYHPQMKVSTDLNGLNRIDLPNMDPGLVLPVWSMDTNHMHRVSVDLKIDSGSGSPLGKTAVASPSHRIMVAPDATGCFQIQPSADGGIEAAPNRDLILDVVTTEPQASIYGSASEQNLPGPQWVAVIPPSLAAASLGVALDDKGIPTGEAGRRRFSLVVDRSGSMSGNRMLQAKQAVQDILNALEPTDEFAILAFDTSVEGIAGPDKDHMAKATPTAVAKALNWLKSIDARGGTEIYPALQEAGRILNGQGDILIITDGEVYSTGAIIEKVAQMGIRVHCIGINTSSQDKFLHAMSKRTGGICSMVGPNETTNITKTALRIFNAAKKPISVNVVAFADGQRIDVGTIWPSEPAVIFAPEGMKTIPKSLVFEGHENSPVVFTRENETYPTLPGLLWVARQITELEAKYDVALPEAQPALWKQLEALSLTFGVASRAASLVAVVKREGDTAGVVPKQQVAPLGLPEDLDPDAYGFSPVRGIGYGNPVLSLSATRNYSAFSGVDVQKGTGPSIRRMATKSASNGNTFCGFGETLSRDMTEISECFYSPELDTGFLGVPSGANAACAAPCASPGIAFGMPKTPLDMARYVRGITMQDGFHGHVCASLLVFLASLENPTAYGSINRKLKFFLLRTVMPLATPEQRAIILKILNLTAVGSWLQEVKDLLAQEQYSDFDYSDPFGWYQITALNL